MLVFIPKESLSQRLAVYAELKRNERTFSMRHLKIEKETPNDMSMQDIVPAYLAAESPEHQCPVKLVRGS